MTFSEYGNFGENNPPVGQGEKPHQKTKLQRLNQTCWLCFNTGEIVDLLIGDTDSLTGIADVEGGPDHGKPCGCGAGKQADTK